MRWIRDLALLTLVLALAGGALAFQRSRREKEAVIQQACAELRRLDLEVKYRAATRGATLNTRGWPVTVDPSWFEQNPPWNSLLSTDRPWVEVAPLDQAGLLHPPVRMSVDESIAAYWYNPYQGLVRARVPVMVSDEKATELYNRINGTAISSIFFNETPPPVPEQQPTTTPAATKEPAPEATAPARREPMMVRVERPKKKK